MGRPDDASFHFVAERRSRSAASQLPGSCHRTTTETENTAMKASLFGLCFLIATATSSAAAQQAATVPATPPTKAEQEVLTLSKDKWRWMSEKKADTLAALFDDKAMFVHMGGAWGKTQEVEII